MREERIKKLESVLAKRQNDLTVVLENVFDPHNAAAVMRSCDAIGIQEVYVLNTRIPRHKEWGYRSGSSATKWLTIHVFENREACIAELRRHKFKILTTSLSDDSVSLYQVDLTQKLALVFGNEIEGVSKEMMALADGNFIIPQMGMIHSLNISVACAVCLYEAFRQKQAAGHYASPKLLEKEFTQLRKQWGLQNEENS